MSEKEHKCHQRVNFDKLSVGNEMNNERVEAEAPCEVCGETITLSFVLDYYEYDGDTIYQQ